MVARPATVFTCSACGASAPKWHGRCPACEEWNTLVEERAPAARAARRGRGARRAAGARPVALRDVSAQHAPRLSTGIGELDRVLGGGLVPGSLVLLGGSPGIGKSTLTNMALGHLRPRAAGRSTSPARSPRPRSACAPSGWRESALDVPVLAETDLDTVLAVLEAERPDVCVIDSVQTLHAAALTASPGTVGQVREVAARDHARSPSAAAPPSLLVGHVTKEGALAGPRVLEHLVDCVLQFEGERERTYRTLRALKNRFGSTNEVGVFEMRDGGLVEVLDASARFVGEATRAPGSVVLAAMEGSRPLLVEVQALVSPSELVPPRRVCNGIDRNRLALVLAVLAPPRGRRRRAPRDVFVNVVGGVRIDEPGADLAVALAVASAARGVPPAAPASAAGVLRRGRPHGRAAPGRPRRPPARRGARSSGSRRSRRRTARHAARRCGRRCGTPRAGACAAARRRPRAPRMPAAGPHRRADPIRRLSAG